MTGFVGIDLGTTVSIVATIDETGRPVIIHNDEGSNITPSVVSFTGKEIFVGEAARKMLGRDRDTVGRFKRYMGTSKVYSVQDTEYTPTQLSAEVLKKLKEYAEAEIGEIAEAVVTIPANFANEAREATMEAAKMAGLNVNFIINEPTAAAMYYGFVTGEEFGGINAFYDLGGGTFDVSIIRASGQDIEVLATNGVSRLGGDDFDEALQKRILEKFNEEKGGEAKPEDFSKNEAEEEKISLSKREKSLARVSSEAGRANIEVTRSEFEEAISSLMAQTEMLCESALDEAGLSSSDISQVFLVGGSTRVPCVRESVKRVFGQEPVATANVDEVVALGAALYAAYKGDQSKLSVVQKKSVEKIKVAEITSKYYGTYAVQRDDARDDFKQVVSIIIKRGEKIPCSVTESFYTVADGQEAVNCVVTESASLETDTTFAHVIWQDKLKLPPDRPAGQEIKITYSYTENQTMRCSFEDVVSHNLIDVDLTMAADSATDGGADKFTVE
jgi:molecular chaperone DnaK